VRYLMPPTNRNSTGQPLVNCVSRKIQSNAFPLSRVEIWGTFHTHVGTGVSMRISKANMYQFFFGGGIH